MRPERCPTCFGRLDTVHRTLGRCPTPPAPPARERASSQRGYVPPSRSYRVPRAEYLAAVKATPEEKAANQRARQKRFRDARRKRAEQ